MNILFICDEYPPFRNGGIGSVTRIVAEGMASRGHCVTIAGYYTSICEKVRKDEINGIEVYRYNLGYRRGIFKSYFMMFLNKIRCAGWFVQREIEFFEDQIDIIIHKKCIDILEVPDFYRFNVYKTRLEYRKFDVPTLLRVHGSVSFMESLSGQNNKYAISNDRNHFQRCDAISSVSKYSKNYFHNHFPEICFGLDEVIYNPLEESFINNSPHSNNKSILFIGKLKETKGVYTLLKAFNSFSKAHPEWTLRLAGHGNIEEILRFIDDDVKRSVIFLGICDRETLKFEIDNCSFACVPTYFENFSMVALEIMGRRRALIYTNRTSGPEVIDDGNNGLLVDPEDAHSVFVSMNRMAEDIDFRYQCADNSYKLVKEKFALTHIINEIESLYLRLLCVKSIEAAN